MTFINRRIIKRPTLFASSRRNFGNLLTHYETGQDGTTPDPDPTPDPVAFTTSWSINGGIVEANLTGISSHLPLSLVVPLSLVYQSRVQTGTSIQPMIYEQCYV